MKHLYQNSEGEVVAADSMEQAARYYECELGGAAEPSPDSGWSQIPDSAQVPVWDRDETGETETKSAREWAEGFSTPEVLASSYA